MRDISAIGCITPVSLFAYITVTKQVLFLTLDIICLGQTRPSDFSTSTNVTSIRPSFSHFLKGRSVATCSILVVITCGISDLKVEDELSLLTLLSFDHELND